MLVYVVFFPIDFSILIPCYISLLIRLVCVLTLRPCHHLTWITAGINFEEVCQVPIALRLVWKDGTGAPIQSRNCSWCSKGSKSWFFSATIPRRTQRWCAASISREWFTNSPCRSCSGQDRQHDAVRWCLCGITLYFIQLTICAMDTISKDWVSSASCRMRLENTSVSTAICCWSRG